MPNLSGGGQNLNLLTRWDTQPQLRGPAAIPASTPITFFTTQAVMRDGSGNFIQCDDTVKGEFVGFYTAIYNQGVLPTDSVYQNALAGDDMLEAIFQPVRYFTQIANVVAGQEGLKVYWLFNNQVQFTVGNNGNFAGTIWQIFDSTHAWILPPWICKGLGQGGVWNSVMTGPTSGTLTLTKWDVNRIFELTPVSPMTVLLPPIASVSPGDQIKFFNLGSGNLITFNGNGANINGGATYTALATTTYANVTLVSDGSQWLAG